MGCFDSVMVPCPACGTEAEFQSKGGECMMRIYHLGHDVIPSDVMRDINRHSPIKCAQCGGWFEVGYGVRGWMPIRAHVGDQRSIDIALRDYDEALAILRMPGRDNDGGAGNLPEEIRCLLHNAFFQQVMAQEIICEALEEAAYICDETLPETPGYRDAQRHAARIRALKDKYTGRTEA